MKIGTKSVLFGAHCWFIHPIFVAAAWSKLYGFPTDPRLWVAFFVHDLGYWGKPNIDGEEGETHVEFGAKIMSRFDRDHWSKFGYYVRPTKWRDLALYHSRFYAKKAGRPVSQLCAADKLAVILEPYWLYMPRIILSGELKEFRSNALTKYGRSPDEVATPRAWYRTMKKVIGEWLADNTAGSK